MALAVSPTKALFLQCNTGYDARIRASCVPVGASSDWSTFSRFSTANVGRERLRGTWEIIGFQGILWAFD